MTYPTQLFNTCRSRLPGAIKVAIDAEIDEAAREICERARVWTEVVEIALVAGTATYAVTLLTPNAEAVNLLGAYNKDLRRSYRAWSGVGPMPENSSFVDLSDTAQVVFSEAPTAAGTMQVVVQLRPVPAAPPNLPDILLNRHHHLLLDGALSRLFDHSSRPYSDIEKAEYHRRKFVGGLGTARAVAHRGRTMHSAPWSYPAFAMGTGRGNIRGGV